MSAPAPLLEARGIVKRFGRVLALRGADFTLFPGEVVALVGDNGAGKSTLVKVLVGVHQADAGTVLLEGEPTSIASPMDARARGLEVVYQDLALAPALDASANLYLGREILRRGVLGRLGFLDKAAMRAATENAFERLGVKIQDPRMPVGDLSGGQRQGVAVGRAVEWASKVLFLDEPTSALGAGQREIVLELIRRARDHGVSVVLVSHNLPEVFEVADRIEVLRLGQRVARFRREQVTMEEIVGAMTGAIVHETAASA
jgi:simple sugar transport system ATP-binding protein